MLRDSERWVGRGLTEAEALDDALAQMFGSAAARTLLAKYAGFSAPPAPPPAEIEAPPAAPEPEPAPPTPTEAWADDAALEPPPRDAAASFEQAIAAIAVLRAPDGEAPDALVDAALRLAQQVRWLRARVDAERWTHALGRLRALASALGERGVPITRLLDPRYRPPMPWSALITGVNGADERRAAGEALRASLVESTVDPDALLSWLVPASEVFTLRELARLLEPHRARVAELEGPAAAHPDRRLRRKLRDLVKRLAAAKHK